MQSLGSLSSTFSGQLQAFQGRSNAGVVQRGQLQVRTWHRRQRIGNMMII